MKADDIVKASNEYSKNPNKKVGFISGAVYVNRIQPHTDKDLQEFAEWCGNKSNEILQRSIEELESISNNYEVINNHYVVKKQTVDNFIQYLQNEIIDTPSDLREIWEIETGRRPKP